MLNGIQPTIAPQTGSAATSGATSQPAGAGVSFSDILKNSIDEVAKLQQDASQATQDLLTGKTQDVTGVFTAMEKSDVAFKTSSTKPHEISASKKTIVRTAKRITPRGCIFARPARGFVCGFPSPRG